MHISRLRQLSLARAAVIAVIVVAAFWLGRISSRGERPTTHAPLAVAVPPDATQPDDDGPVPMDPLKLGYKTLRIVNTVLARQAPMDLYRCANELATFDQDRDAGRMRETLRADLRIAVYSLAMGAQGWGVTTGLDENALRQVSTYYATVPDPDMDARATAWLAEYPPYTRAELAKSQCEDPICTMARSTTRRSAP
jgi:hypothetical protein